MKRIAAFLLLVASSAIASQDANLAALARKEKERRAKVAKPAPVLTEDDTRSQATRDGSAVTAMPAATVTSSGPDLAAVQDAQADLQARRAEWKARMDAARQAVTAAESRLESLQDEMRRYASDLTVVPADEAQDPLRLQKRQAKLTEMAKGIEQQKAAVAAARQGVTDLETQARRDGVPPGWLR